MPRGKKPVIGKIVTGVKNPASRKALKAPPAAILAAGPRQPVRRPMPSRPPRAARAG